MVVPPTARQMTITLFGVPGAFATFPGLRSALDADQPWFFLLREGSRSEQRAFSFFHSSFPLSHFCSLDFSLIMYPETLPQARCAFPLKKKVTPTSSDLLKN
jgi:hypothetical protein